MAGGLPLDGQALQIRNNGDHRPWRARSDGFGVWSVAPIPQGRCNVRRDRLRLRRKFSTAIAVPREGGGTEMGFALPLTHDPKESVADAPFEGPRA
jgi:hypothetical protein